MNTLKRATILISICSVIAFAQAKQMSAEAILARIEAVGARQVIDENIRTASWDRILDGIGSGDPKWLDVYTMLRAHSDGASREDLEAALWNRALPNAPFRVFALAEQKDPYLLVDKPLCVFTLESECIPDGIESYLNRLERALSKARSTWSKQFVTHA